MKSMQQKVVKTKSKLAGTKVFMDDDITREERKVQAQIRKVITEENRKGRRVKMGYGFWYWKEKNQYEVK